MLLASSRIAWKLDLESACNARNRGGYDKLVSSGVDQPITITIYYRESKNDRPITYEVSIGKDEKTELPIVLNERLRQRAKSSGGSGRPRSFLHLEKGKGTVYIQVMMLWKVMMLQNETLNLTRINWRSYPLQNNTLRIHA